MPTFGCCTSSPAFPLAKVLLENASDAAKVAIIKDDEDVTVPNEGEGHGTPLPSFPHHTTVIVVWGGGNTAFAVVDQ